MYGPTGKTALPAPTFLDVRVSISVRFVVCIVAKILEKKQKEFHGGAMCRCRSQQKLGFHVVR